ncbi:MAG TPA: hypothetical protein VEA69_19980 [Tepidisphaeraceae bacterium]|nr:hypothetical protein [Tepidisphaeraceae bacterium]
MNTNTPIAARRSMVLRVIALLFSVGLFGTYVVYGAEMFVWLGLVPKAAATAPATTSSPAAPTADRQVIMAGSKSKSHLIDGQRVTYTDGKVDWSGPVMGGSKSAAVVAPPQLSGANLTPTPSIVDRSVLMLGSKSGAVVVQPPGDSWAQTAATQPLDRRVLMPDSKYLVITPGSQQQQPATTTPPSAMLMGGSKTYTGVITVLQAADGKLTVATPTGAPAAPTTRPATTPPATAPVERRILMPSSKDIILTPQK